MKKSIITSLILCIFMISCTTAPVKKETNNNKALKVTSGPAKDYTWKKISGKWSIDTERKVLKERKRWALDWGYSELINLNSIISEKRIPSFTEFKCSAKTQNPVKNKVQQMYFFSGKNFRHFHAVRLTGDKERFNTAEIIKCTPKDPTKSRKVKWNFKITPLASKEIDIPYDEKNKIEITNDDRNLELHINGSKILDADTDDELENVKIGFSSRNAAMEISGLSVKNGRDVVFKDDFTVDSIKRYRAKFKRKRKK